MHLTPSHVRFLAAVRIVSFLSAVSCRYVCCYCYSGKKITMLEAWQLQMRFIYSILFIYSIYSSCILCDWHLFGRPSFVQSCFMAGLLSIHYKNGKQVGKSFQLEFHWRKFIVGFAPIWWESSSFLLKIQRQDCWLVYGGFYYLSFSQSMQMTAY